MEKYLCLDKLYIKMSLSFDSIIGLRNTLNNKSEITHNHIIDEVVGLQSSLDTRSLTGHNHNQNEVIGLTTSLSGKSDNGHIHSIANITDLQTTLDSKALSVHTHSIANVTALQTSLDSKASSVHTHSSVDLTNMYKFEKIIAPQTTVTEKIIDTTKTVYGWFSCVNYSGNNFYDQGSLKHAVGTEPTFEYLITYKDDLKQFELKNNMIVGSNNFKIRVVYFLF
jgi:hypothetical protein